jgi:hypothetical protein
MLSRTRWLLVPALLLFWLGLVGPAPAVYPPPIKDDGKFFSAEVADKANKKIKEVYDSSKKDLVIETYAAFPDAKKLPEEANKKAEAITAWSKSRAKELGVNGVYVLICKEPTVFRIQVDPRTYRRAFTKSDIERLSKTMIAGLREKKFDDALKGGVDVVEAALKANAK